MSGQTRSGQYGNGCIGPRYRDDWNIPSSAFANHSETRVADARVSGVRNQGHRFPLLEKSGQFDRFPDFVFLPIRDQGLGKGEVVEQLFGNPRILTGNQIALVQGISGPCGKIRKISDWSGDQIEDAVTHRLRSQQSLGAQRLKPPRSNPPGKLYSQLAGRVWGILSSSAVAVKQPLKRKERLESKNRAISLVI